MPTTKTKRPAQSQANPTTTAILEAKPANLTFAADPRTLDPPPLTCEELVQFSQEDRQSLEMFAEILRRYSSGAITPAEGFIRGVIRSNYLVRALTPQDAKDAVEEFEIEFEMAVKATDVMVHSYPELLRNSVADAYGCKALRERGARK